MTCFQSIYLIITLSTQTNWNIHHPDVKLAFLNGKIKEEIYVKQPKGFLKKGKENYVLRLKKKLYALKVALRAWNFRLDACLISLGFKKS